MITMTRLKAIIPILAAALLVLPRPSSAQYRDLSLSAGIGIGDFNNCFVAGLALSKPVASSIQSEVELIYYRMPADRSTVFGLAITSTAVDLNLSVLFQTLPEDRKFIPYAVITAGIMFESETYKYSLLKTKEGSSYLKADLGVGAGAKILLGPRSGMRVDIRWLRVLGKNVQVPRFTLGYFYRY